MITTARLRHIAQINPGTPAFDKLDAGDDVTFLPMEAVWPDSRLDLSRRRTKKSVITGYTRFQDGDILVPKITPTFQASRAVLIGGLHSGVGAGSTELHVVRPGKSIDPRYLLYLFHTHSFLKLGEAEMYGVAGQQRVPDDFLRDFPVPLLSLAEQRRIADFLDAETARIEKLVTSLQRELDLLAERRAAGIVEAVSGSAHTDRRSSTLAWLDSVPTAWPEVRLGLLARMGSGHTPSRSRPEWWTDCYIPWVTTGEVWQVRDDRVEDLYETREKISELGLANSAAELHPAGTVFLCRTASAGYSGVMGVDMATSQDFVTWTCGPRLVPHFLLWCLRAMRPDLLGRLAMGSTHKTIYVPDLQMLRIPLPSVNEQKEIVQTIRRQNNRIDSLTDRVRRQQELLRERREALITAAVTGQFDVTTASGRNVTEGVAV
ncbi:restriction endonuclease subunit S [Streptomyces thermoviolaceus]|uniref:restriction endonuclease subunit S n=1 Tax=Streptomyces thermoviolaceus TaxID=1952 RepID=UPI001679C7A4|nr:restriction endonuclease subunit S [Streptomyces thermoviolaceus]MCM3266189.1 restriction endonuclease subunit S [Streptomyces thermoviolaceus]GGV76981.1 type I restriction endonuclease [Streptomyces thermoviolaceus subsp. apingens]